MKIRESFSLPYGGGELWASCLDGFKNEVSLIHERILKEEKLICKPSTPSLVLYHLYDTEINYELAGVLVESLFRCQRKVKKIAIVGLSKGGKQKVKSFLKASKMKFELCMKYYDDFEAAKEWLVSER